VQVLADVEQGYVSPGRAASDYGIAVVKTGHAWHINDKETARLRASGRTK
jgi:N-methylhydantoinase B/oxoprolinase/acetone carboxylase alpha subunit